MTHRQRQNLLQFLGYDPGTPDNIWGDRSRRAVEAFQRDHGLPVTGTGDEATDTALLDAVAHWEPDNGTSPGNNGAAQDNNGTFWEEIEFFDRSEFKCTCGGRGCNGYPAEPKERLVRNMDMVRKHFGRPVTVSSGVRCKIRNSELPGSAANSLHLGGGAADFTVPGRSADTVVAFCRTLPEVHECYAIDGSYVHMGVQKY